MPDGPRRDDAARSSAEETRAKVDLGEATGLPLVMKEDGCLEFGQGMVGVRPAARTLDEMKDVLWNQTASGPAVLYLMYRRVGRTADVSALSAAGLRYDITVIFGGDVGGEHPKTHGHYHPACAEGGLTYPEIYEVAHGTAHVILQKPSPGDPKRIEDVLVIEARAGERVVIPPGYGHVTVNPEGRHLVMANVVAQFESIYDEYKELRGAAYYELASDEGPAVWVPNDRYEDLPRPRFAEAGHMGIAGRLGLRPGVPLYRWAVSNPETLTWLSDPKTVAWDVE